MSDSTFVTRARIKNYKSIGGCDVPLGPLTFLVGPNGAGKSNFLDALRFVADALNTTVDHALRDRGGVNEVRRRSGGHPNHFGLRLELRLPSGQTGHYAFRIGAQAGGGFEVRSEECVLRDHAALGREESFTVASGEAASTVGAVPPASGDRLYLVTASSLPQFRPAFDALSRMGFYNLNPGEVRDLQLPDAGVLLARDGRNLSSVLGELAAHDRPTKERIEEYLAQVVPGIRGVDKRAIGPRETLEFRQQVAGSKNPWRFLATSMSDGTLRALGILVALFQPPNGALPVPLVGIEEPEAALHPAAAGVLLDALTEASTRLQVIVTSHSPDLLDSNDVPTDSILAVSADDDVTTIGPVDDIGRSVLHDRLFTAGELLRQNQLEPDAAARRVAHGAQLRLFDSLSS